MAGFSQESANDDFLFSSGALDYMRWSSSVEKQDFVGRSSADSIYGLVLQNNPLTNTLHYETLANPLDLQQYVSDAAGLTRLSGLVSGTYSDIGRTSLQSQESHDYDVQKPSLSHSNLNYGTQGQTSGGDVVVGPAKTGGKHISFEEVPPTFCQNNAPLDSTSTGRKKKKKTDENEDTPVVVAKIKARRKSVKRDLNHKSAMGKTVVLDEIINYVKSLQNQVEILSKKLASATAQYDFRLEMDNDVTKELRPIEEESKIDLIMLSQIVAKGIDQPQAPDVLTLTRGRVMKQL